MMKKSCFVMILLSSSSAFTAGVLTNIEGTYTCMGNEVGTHQAFTCQMTIKKTGETYASVAKCSDGHAYRGIGIYDKATHRLSTGFMNPQKPEETGVSVTKIRLKTDGVWVSEWTYIDRETIGHTKCFKQPAKS